MRQIYESTKVIELGSCAFRQWRATHSHCSKLHGYQLKAKLWFGCSSLDDKNWVVDFGGLKHLKQILNNQFDHTTCVAQDDPELELFQELEESGVIQLRIMPGGVGIERVAEFVFKTADAYIREVTEDRCWVSKVEAFEHEENSATYAESQSRLPNCPASPVVKKEVTLSHSELAEPPAEIILNEMTSTGSTAAQVGNFVSEGKGGWFEGTSWAN